MRSRLTVHREFSVSTCKSFCRVLQKQWRGFMGRGLVLLTISIAPLLWLPSTISSQVAGNAPAGQESPRIKNISPEEVQKRVRRAVPPV